MRFLASFALCLTISMGQASATIIDYGDYTAVNGYDWLDLSLTDNKSLTYAIDTYGSQGYMLATKTQYMEMISEFFSVTADTVLDVHSTVSWNDFPTAGYAFTTTPGSDYSNFSFLKLFGLSYDPPPSQSISYRHEQSYGLYNDGGIGRLGGADVYDDFDDSRPDFITVLYAFTEDYSAYIEGGLGVGYFLVRKTKLNSNGESVPAPATFLLMGIGLLGFGAVRHKRKKTAGNSF